MSKKIQTSEPANHIAVFQEKTIRRTWHGSEWWVAIGDVVAVLAMLGEAGTTEIVRRKDARGFTGNRSAAKTGGTMACMMK